MLRASIAAERVGIPSVSIVCEGFDRQGAATGRGHGFDGMALAVTIGHVDAQSADVMVANFVTHTVEQVVAGLTRSSAPSAGAETGAEPSALDVVATGSIDDINRRFAIEAWSDGLPVIPPTRDRVEAFLAVTGHDPWRTLGLAKSTGRDITVWSIAVNAVMTGCDPAHLPVLIAAAEILADPGYGAEHSGNTTGADALMILSGPTATGLGFNCHQGALRDGTPANTTVGRWLRLYLRNVFGFTDDEHDKATFGNTFRVVLTEDHATLSEIGWPSVGAGFGFGADDDVLTMARFNSGAIIGSVYGSTPEETIPYLADGLTRVTSWDLTHMHGLGHDQYRPLLILSPVLARTFARAGWSLDDVRAALFRHARIPASRFERYIGEWTNLTAGRPTLTDLVGRGLLPPVFAESTDPDRPVPIVGGPDRFVVTVAGDPNRTNAYALSNDGPHGWYTAKRVDYTPSSDLACIVPPPSPG